MSQIDMVILLDDSTLQVCGGLQREQDKVPGRDARLYVVVRQGDAIATGGGTCGYGSPRWKLRDVKVPRGLTTHLQAGPALACGVAIVEKDPAGLEAFSWLQQVKIQADNPLWEGQEPPPIDFSAAPQHAVPQEGQLDAAQAIASSLTVTPSDGGSYRWTQELEIRPLPPPIE